MDLPVTRAQTTATVAGLGLGQIAGHQTRGSAEAGRTHDRAADQRQKNRGRGGSAFDKATTGAGASMLSECALDFGCVVFALMQVQTFNLLVIHDALGILQVDLSHRAFTDEPRA